MPYRRTDNVVRKESARRDAILRAARDLAAEGGIAAVQMAPVAAKAGIAAGTVYRYFPAKIDLLAALIAALAERELAAARHACDLAPGPLSALAAVIMTFAARALMHRRLAFALIAELVECEAESVRIGYRRQLAEEFETRIRAAMSAGYLPEQDCQAAAAAIVGGLIEGLIGPLASQEPPRVAVQSLALFCLRALGVVDARARGLVVQTRIPG